MNTTTKNIEALTFGGHYLFNTESMTCYNQSYGVTMDIQQGTQKNRISYVMETSCVKKPETYLWEVTLKKRDWHLNGKRPQGFKNQYDFHFGLTVLYPITLAVAPSGIVKEITDSSYQRILERFETFKQKSKQQAQGPEMIFYLDSLEKGINSKKKVLRYLMADWFWALYFAPIYQDTKNQLLFPLNYKIPQAPYTGKITTKAEKSYYNTRQILFNGRVADSYWTLYPNLQQKAQIKICYDFDEKQHTLQHITALQSCETSNQLTQEIQINVHRITEESSQNAENNDTVVNTNSNNSLRERIAKWWNA